MSLYHLSKPSKIVMELNLPNKAVPASSSGEFLPIVEDLYTPQYAAQGYKNIFNRLRRVPPATMEKGYPANQQPLHWPSKNMAFVQTLAQRLTHFLCKKCFSGKEGLEAKTVVSFKARFKFKTEAYV